MSLGYLSLVLHSHLPYIRHPEVDHHFEERWLFEAITETYIPLIHVFNKLLEDGKATAGTLNAVDDLFSQLGGDVLGIVKDEHPQVGVIDDTRLDELVQILIEQRNEARQRKDYAKADELRERLEKIGIVLEDKPDGTQWRWK